MLMNKDRGSGSRGLGRGTGRGAKRKEGKEYRERRDKKGEFGIERKRFCRFCIEKLKKFDYKDVKRIEKFVSERGKIISRRFSGNCARHQRKLSEAIRRARHMSLLPYIKM